MNRLDQAVLDRLRSETLDVWGRIIGRDRDVVLLDVPSHRNLGDTMIWIGELAYLQSLGCRVVYWSDLRRYDAASVRRAAGEDVPILIHGGGNFGDVWPIFQRGREQVVKDFPDRRIVQLPQSVEFSSPALAERAEAVFAAHPAFTLMVRDNMSQAKVASLLPQTDSVHCPDAALGWSPFGAVDSDGPVLALIRNDHEALHPVADLVRGVLEPRDTISDWSKGGWGGQLGWHVYKTPGRLTSVLRGLRASAAYRPILETSGTRLLKMNLGHATKMFDGRRLVITDRLHAHVLATLLGIPNIVFDNSYKKISAIVDDYTGEFSTTHFAATPEEGRALIDSLIRAEKIGGFRNV